MKVFCWPWVVRTCHCHPSKTQYVDFLIWHKENFPFGDIMNAELCKFPDELFPSSLPQVSFSFFRFLSLLSGTKNGRNGRSGVRQKKKFSDQLTHRPFWLVLARSAIVCVLPWKWRKIAFPFFATTTRDRLGCARKPARRLVRTNLEFVPRLSLGNSIGWSEGWHRGAMCASKWKAVDACTLLWENFFYYVGLCCEGKK